MTGRAADVDARTGADLRALAQEAYDLVGVDHVRALALAESVVAAVPARGATEEQRQAESIAHRAAALALVDAPDLPTAEQRARRAAVVARRAGLVVVEAEATLTLAYVLLERGRGGAALAALDAVAPRLGPHDLARLRVQRALVLHRGLGRPDEALLDYAAALPVLEEHDDRLWTAGAHHNRAQLFAYAGDLDAAIADENRAYVEFASLGKTLSATRARLDLAWLLGIAGRIPDSLQLFDEASQELPGFDAITELDRADILLRAGLAHDAVEAAHRAVAWLTASDDREGLFTGEAELMLSRALVRVGDVDGAVRHLDNADARFREHRRDSWASLAAYVREVAALRGPAPSSPTARTVRTVRDLLRRGWRGYGVELAVAAAECARERGQHRRARDLLTLVVPRGSDLLEVRGRVHHASALTEILDGRTGQASRELARAWAAGEQLRGLTGATELQAQTSAHVAGVVGLALELALRRRSVAQVLRWSERGRAATLRHPPAVPPPDPQLAAAIARLRFATQADDVDRLGGATARLHEAERRRREAEVVRLSRHAAARRGQVRTADGDDVRSRLEGRVLVLYAAVRDDLVAVVVDPRRTTLVPIGPAASVQAGVSRLEITLRRAASGVRSPSAEAGPGPHAESLASTLLGPLSPFLGDRDVVISPTGSLWRLPWSWLPPLRGRPTSLTPSATVWCRAVDRIAAPQAETLIVAGPGLDAAESELDAVAGLHPGARVLAREEATVDAVCDAFGRSDLAHLTVHGTLRTDNPLFSSLALADGPLTAYAIERLARTPRTVVLPSCHSGEARGPVADELLGLAWTFLGRGTSSVVAALAAVPDVATVAVMRELHRGLAGGSSPAVALARAQDELGRSPDPLVRAAAAAFVCLGS